MSDQKDFRNLVAELKEAVTSDINGLQTESAETKSKLDKINEQLDKIEFDQKTQPAPINPELKKKASVAEFSELLGKFAQGERKGLNVSTEVKSQYHQSLNTKSDNLVRFDLAAAGALLLPNDISADIIKNVTEFTPAMSLASVTTTNRSNYERRVRTDTAGGQWLSEEVQNVKTKPKYAIVKIPPQKWGARYGWSIEQQQDTGYDLIAELNQSFREDFSVDMGAAFISGDGVGKPTGMLGNITNFDTTQLAITTDDLIKLQESLKEDYHGNASWLFTRKTRAYIRTLVLSSTNGLQYTWEPDFQRKSPTLLLGAPVTIARDGDLAGRVSGNFTAGQVYAIYGDFSQGYEVTMHTDMYMIDDPYTDASSFVRNLNIMTRVGGAPIKAEALVQATAAGS